MKRFLYLILCAFPIISYCKAIPEKNYGQNVKYLQIKPTIPVESGKACKDVKFTVNLMGNTIKIHSNKGDLDVNNELEDHSPTLIAGDFWGNGHCFLALMTAKSDVNESYNIYEISPSTPPKKVTSTPDLINPDFKDGVVISSYRDAARWHKENLCYPSDKKPYLCEKSDYINDLIDATKQCTPSGTCSPAVIVRSGSGEPAKAIVIKDKAAILMPEPSGKMKPQKSYLIRGDKVELLDYLDNDTGSYFKFKFTGKKIDTTGWTEASSLKIEK